MILVLAEVQKPDNPDKNKVHQKFISIDYLYL